MKRLLMVVSLLVLTSCGDDKVYTPDHIGQINDNTKRIELLEASDAAQDALIAANASAISSETDARQQADTSLQTSINNEKDARIAQDIILADRIRNNRLAQQSINQNFRNRFSRIFNSLSNIRDKLSNLSDRIRANRGRISVLRSDLNSLSGEVSSVQSRVTLLETASNLHAALIQANADNLAVEIQNRIAGDQQNNQNLSISQFFQSLINGYLFSRVNSNNNRINILQSNLALLTERVSDNETDIAALQSQMVTIQSQVDDLREEMNTANSDIYTLQSQMTTIQDQAVSLVYPCGEGNSEEVLIQTQDGLVAYFQEVSNQTDSFSVGQTIPEHFVCDKFYSGNGNSKRCKEGRNVPASSASQNVSITHQVLETAYLSVLGQGNYRTTDGYSCNFSINSNGELQ